MIDVPEALAASLAKYGGEAGRVFVAALPALAERFLDQWDLRPDGPARHGWAALVLPVVRRGDGVPAALKLQALDAETEGEPVALRRWDGDGAVRLIGHDPGTGTMLLERLDAERTLDHLPDSREAALVIARLLARLTAAPAPPGLRGLGDIAHDMLEQVPRALAAVPDPASRRLVARCAAAVREVVDEPGDRLLHWDLHYGNVLGSERVPWLAIDPKPLAGDPGFDLLPALDNRYDPAETQWRFDALTDVLGLDRARAHAWCLGRVLQNLLWNLEDDDPLEREQLEIARDLHP
ncbi:aminoglycoside phosphotransferase family protein [Streptomyces sp. SID8352]|uniref:aminoglycoside phosphotransferase family protein n=1 Tax=Streptomyces sp. SID8352 TaxID=2690338 RepID=UPI00136C3341|nr:hydroxyurea phosphotransferase [Streptomyces sp. SID8352]